MAAFSRGVNMGLGLGLGLAQRVSSCGPNVATTTFSQQTMAIAARVVRLNRSPSRSPWAIQATQAVRSLQTSARLQASKHAAQPKPQGSQSKPRAPAPSQQPAQAEPALSPVRRRNKAVSQAIKAYEVSSVTAKLVAHGQPIILYQSPSHFWLRFSSLSAAAFLISYAGINYYSTIVRPPTDLPWWVPFTFAMVCLVSAGFGYLFLFATARIVRRITAVPTASLPASYLESGTKKNLTAAEYKARKALRAGPLALECEVGGTIPLLGNRKLYAAPIQVLLPFKFGMAPVSRASAAAAVTAQRPAQEPQGSVASIFVKPFAAVGRGFSGAFYGLRRGLTSEGFSPIIINGKRYKIDVFSGKVLDDGTVLDILMPYRPERFSNTWLDRLLKR